MFCLAGFPEINPKYTSKTSHKDDISESHIYMVDVMST